MSILKDIAKGVAVGAINNALGVGNGGESRGFNVNNLMAGINKSGLAKASHFEVQITGAGDSVLEEEMMKRVDTVDLPGRSLMTAEHKFSNYGPVNKVPYGGQTYGDATISIILSEDMREKEYFEIWQNKMVNTGAFETGSGQQDFYGGYVQSKFNTKYFDDYLGTVTIRQYGAAGDLRSIHTLNEAYPIILNPISMSWGSDEIAKMNVTFAYRNYKVVFQKSDQPGMGFGFSFNLGKNGLGGSLRLPGVGTISGSTGGGFKAVTAKSGVVSSIRSFF
jgi:hypothetical protein